MVEQVDLQSKTRTSASRSSKRIGSRMNWQAAATWAGGGRAAAAAAAASASTVTSALPWTASAHVLEMGDRRRRRLSARQGGRAEGAAAWRLLRCAIGTHHTSVRVAAPFPAPPCRASSGGDGATSFEGPLGLESPGECDRYCGGQIGGHTAAIRPCQLGGGARSAARAAAVAERRSFSGGCKQLAQHEYHGVLWESPLAIHSEDGTTYWQKANNYALLIPPAGERPGLAGALPPFWALCRAERQRCRCCME